MGADHQHHGCEAGLSGPRVRISGQPAADPD